MFLRMAELVVRPQEIRRILSLTSSQAEALGDPLRVALLEELEREPRSVDELTRALRARGFKKAPTTIRHHVDLLKTAGLIDLVRAEEARGAVLKYYAANTKVLHYDAPPNFLDRFAPAINVAEKEARRLVQRILESQGDELRKTAEALKACPHCTTDHFLEYLVLRILDAGMARTLPELFHEKRVPLRIEGA